MGDAKVREDGMIELDTTDVDRWVGKPLGGAQLKEPVEINDLNFCFVEDPAAFDSLLIP